MGLGVHAANLANKWLGILQAGTAFASPPSSGLFFKLHIGDPGAAGATSPSVNTTRVIAPHSGPAAGVIAQTGTPPQWAMTATETISHISVWDALTSGLFLYSFALAVAQGVVNTNTFTMTSYSVTITPIAS